MDIKPIETVYNGYRFRSRLEARWAVFFDAMKLTWQYEREGYKVHGVDRSKTFWYLPDFYMPQLKIWIEVKPDYETLQLDLEKIKAFWWDVDCIAYLLGMPDPDYPIGNTLYAGFLADDGGGFGESAFRFVWCPDHNRAEIAVGHGGHKIVNPHDFSALPVCHELWTLCWTNDPHIKAAAIAARQARFEHGANGR